MDERIMNVNQHITALISDWIQIASVYYPILLLSLLFSYFKINKPLFFRIHFACCCCKTTSLQQLATTRLIFYQPGFRAAPGPRVSNLSILCHPSAMLICETGGTAGGPGGPLPCHPSPPSLLSLSNTRSMQIFPPRPVHIPAPPPLRTGRAFCAFSVSRPH